MKTDKKKHAAETEPEVKETAAEETAEAENTEAAEPENNGTEALKAELEAAKAKCAEYLEDVKRAQADFYNYKRRNDSAKAEAYNDGVRDTLTALLPVIDNLERALEHAAASGDDGPMAEGVKMTLNQLTASFEKLGLEEVKAQGEKFDPELHNAVMRVEEGEPGCVQAVLQKGYRAKGKIIRYAMVSVTAE